MGALDPLVEVAQPAGDRLVVDMLRLARLLLVQALVDIAAVAAEDGDATVAALGAAGDGDLAVKAAGALAHLDHRNSPLAARQRRSITSAFVRPRASFHAVAAPVEKIAGGSV